VHATDYANSRPYLQSRVHRDRVRHEIHRIRLVVRESETDATSYVLEATQPMWDAGAGATLRAIAGLPPR
jgi:hypothetical protein